MLDVEGARVSFGGHAALDGVDLRVGPGETLAVLGPSGCGKSTLLRAIAGLQPLDVGTFRWNGDDITTIPAHQRRFGLMFQEYALFPHRDVVGNVDFGLRMQGLDRARRAARVAEVLDLVGLGDAATRKVANLSGGEQQRVALARALAVQPRLIMLDEPLAALDRALRDRLLDEITALLAREHLPAIYVTHDQDEAFAIATEIAVMRAGRIIQRGTPADVWTRPADAWTAEFLGFGPAFACEARRGVIVGPWGEHHHAEIRDGGVSLLVRPDALHLSDAGEIRGAVARTTFAGARVAIAIEPESGPEFVVHVASGDVPRPGSAVRVAVEPSAVLLYPRD
jgi:thiamine transport system ATP-binding protein